MINVAVQQGSSSSSTMANGSANYGALPSSSPYGRHHNGNPPQQAISAKEVYHRVVVPTIFPGGHRTTSTTPNIPRTTSTYHQLQQECRASNNNNDYKYSNVLLANPYQRVNVPPVYHQQQPPTSSPASPSLGYSFMQQQLHQYRQQQQSVRPSASLLDRNYVYHGLRQFQAANSGGPTPPSIPIGLRSPILHGQRAPPSNVQQQSPSNLLVSASSMAAAHSSHQSSPSPSPKRASSRKHHHHHGHHYHFSQTSGGAYDLLESEALQRRHRFPTNFCRVLREMPPPVPPILLRTVSSMSAATLSNGGGKAAPASALPRYKDPANRLKITLRVLSSASTSAEGGGGSPEASFLAVDTRKKQITLMEQAQQSQRQPFSSASAAGASNGGNGGGSSSTMVPKIFGFDATFSPDDSQTEICSTALTEVVQTVVNEGDGCVLLFGSSDQGKIHTSIGNDSNAQTLGILPCAVSWLYRLITEVRQRTGARFSIRVSAVEVSGPREDLRDLLADLTGVPLAGNDPASGSYEACLREDPVFGTQLHNVSELRAPTPDKAAFYLDVALAKRRAGTEEERRNSHFFFTLHIYQYRVNEKQQQQRGEEQPDAAVAGGRTRLHLIDLGAGEKNSKPGRASLTLPALGNVLLTLLQGQKHLPFKESKVTQILKSCIGSVSCKAVSVVACASNDPERRMETVNVVQIAGRLYRIRRTKRGSTKLGFGAGNSSGGESSTDDRSGRRRFPRSASDPDCTTSSSEQSCDTVIYLGAGGARSRAGSAVSGVAGGIPTSVAISDQDIPPPLERPNADRGGGGLAAAIPRSPAPSSKGMPSSARVTHTAASGRQQTGSGQRQATYAPSAKSCGGEQWIDGPKASKQPKLGPMESAAAIAAQNLKGCLPPPSGSGYSSVLMDPLKREMIRQWVVHQEQERAAFQNAANAGEIWIDRSPKAVVADMASMGNYEGTGARPKLFSTMFGQQQRQETQDDKVSLHSMETSSSAQSVSSSCGAAAADPSSTETKDIGLQCYEEEIDIDCGRYPIPLAALLNDVDGGNLYQQHNNNTINQEYAAVATWTEPEMRMLEDIAEVEEDENTISTVSDGAPIGMMAVSKQSTSARAAAAAAAIMMTSGSPPYRNEAMAPRPPMMIEVDGADGFAAMLTTTAAPSTSSLRSLTQEPPEYNDYDDEHPLRILSKEKMTGSRSDTFSLDNDDDGTDALSLPTSDMFLYLGGELGAVGGFRGGKHSGDEDSSSLTDEDLERAMQASLTSIRSHEILEKLKYEGKLRRTAQNECDEEVRSMRDEDESSEKMSSRKSSFGRPVRPEPEGFTEDKSEKFASSLTQQKFIDPKSAVQPSKLQMGDKLIKPTVPQLSKPMANLVTSQLISGLANCPTQKEERSSASSRVQKQLQPPIAGKQQPPQASPAISVCEGHENHADMQPSQSSLPRPTKLPSPRSQDRFASHSPAKSQKESSKLQQTKEKEKPKTMITVPAVASARVVQSPSMTNKAKPATPPVPVAIPQPPLLATTAPSSPAISEKGKKSTASSVLKSPIMSFLKSPSKFKKPAATLSASSSPVPTPKTGPAPPLSPSSGLNPPPTPTSASKRASSGYDSGHDSGIVTVDSPDLLLASPYSKLTKPRASQRSSSGHGSDNSSAVSSDAGASGSKLGRPPTVAKLATPSLTKKPSPNIVTPSKTASARKGSAGERDTNGGGGASSSGYESGHGSKGNNKMDTITTAIASAASVTSPESSSDADATWAPDRLKSPPSVKLHRKRWLEGFGFDASKSRSAPQSPSSTGPSRGVRLPPPDFAAETSLDSQLSTKILDQKQRVTAVENLKQRQRDLKRELKQAKDRLGIPSSKWSYDLHVADCMETTNPNMLEALNQETKILEKRVAACKSHILMVTVFDAVPSVTNSPETTKKCS